MGIPTKTVLMVWGGLGQLYGLGALLAPKQLVKVIRSGGPMGGGKKVPKTVDADGKEIDMDPMMEEGWRWFGVCMLGWNLVSWKLTDGFKHSLDKLKKVQQLVGLVTIPLHIRAFNNDHGLAKPIAAQNLAMTVAVIAALQVSEED